MGSQRILDLGCGTGANLRYLAPRLGGGSGAGFWGHQEWLCLDKDPQLLADLSRRTAAWARDQGWPVETLPEDQGLVILAEVPGDWRVRKLVGDLAQGAEWLPVAPGTLVTASALLDLVSGDWLAGLLRVCAQAGAPLLLALSYDGRVELSPAHPLDETLITLVNAHQRGDKGLGPALGPSAPARLAELAPPLGLELELAPSDWELGAKETELQSALVAGWVAAAGEQAARIGPSSSALREEIRRWHQERRGQMAAGRLRIRVGHQDALLWPGPGVPPS